MTFCIQYGEQECQGRLLYLSKEHSFDISPKAKFGGQSLLVNEVQLELTDELAIGYLWGLCPSSSWLFVKLTPPTARKGKLFFKPDKPLVTGISLRISSGIRWPVSFDKSNGWICIGETDLYAEHEAVLFYPQCVAVIRAEELISLWLKPSFKC